MTDRNERLTETETIRAAAATATPPDDRGEQRSPFGDARDDVVARIILGDDDDGGLPLTKASAIVSRRTRWLSEGRIPRRTVTLLVGDGGLGKSTYSLALAARLTRGQEPGDYHRIPQQVLILSAEDAPSETIRPRLAAAGADLDRVLLPRLADLPGPLTLPDDVEQIMASVAVHDVALVIVDPVVSFLGTDTDSHVDKAVRRSLAPVAHAAEQANIAILGLVHVNKSKARTLTARINGSVGFRNLARSVLLFAADPEADDGAPERVLIHEKCNVGPLTETLRYRLETADTEERDPDDGTVIEAARLAYLGVAEGITAATALADAGDDDERLPATQALATEIILDAFAEPCEWADVVPLIEAEGISERTGRRARDKLRRDGQVERSKAGFQGRWLWHQTTAYLANSGGDTEQVATYGERQAQNAYPARENPILATRTDSPPEVATYGDDDNKPEDLRDE